MNPKENSRELPVYDATDQDMSIEGAYLNLFCKLKSDGIFGDGKEVIVKVSANHYGLLDYFCRYRRKPARMEIGDYSLLVVC